MIYSPSGSFTPVEHQFFSQHPLNTQWQITEDKNRICSEKLNESTAKDVSERLNQIIASLSQGTIQEASTIVKGLHNGKPVYHTWISRHYFENLETIPLPKSQELALTTPESLPNPPPPLNGYCPPPFKALNKRIATDPEYVQLSLQKQAERAEEQQNNQQGYPKWNKAITKEIPAKIKALAAPTNEFAILSTKGRREDNEDTGSIDDISFKVGDQQLSAKLFVISDGHGSKEDIKGKTPGQYCAEYAVKNLKSYLEKQLENQFSEIPQNQTENNEWQDLAIFNALKLSFAELSQALEAEFSQILNEKSRRNTIGGATLTAVLQFNGTLFTACAGDSRAITASKADTGIKTTPLSFDAHPADPKSLNPKDIKANKSVFNRGSSVEYYRKGLICGPLLAVTRAIGNDHHGIDPRPKITKRKAEGFLIVASDGLWAVANNQQVADEWLTQIENATLEEAAKNLIKKAYQSGSRDNITALVARL